MRTRTAAGVRLAGSGSSAPAHVLTNADLSQLVETNDEWIAQRTGIRCVFFVFALFGRLSTTSRSSGRDRSKKKEKRTNANEGKLLVLASLSSMPFPPQVIGSMQMIAIVGLERGRKNGREREREIEIEKETGKEEGDGKKNLA